MYTGRGSTAQRLLTTRCTVVRLSSGGTYLTILMLQEAQAETNFDECMDTKSMISSLDQTTAQCDGTDSSISESFSSTASTEMKHPVFNPSSSNQAEDAAISVPSDNCDYMELECHNSLKIQG